MAVKRLTYVRELKYRRTVEFTTYTHSWLVELDDAWEPRRQIEAARPDWSIGQERPEDPGLYCVGIQIDQRKHSLLFDVTLDYSTFRPELFDDPLRQPAKIRVVAAPVTLSVVKDHEGRAITYTNSRPIVGIEEEFSFALFQVEKNISPNYPDWLLNYPQAQNADVVPFRTLQLQPDTLKIARFEIGDEQTHNGVRYCPLSLDIMHNPFTWNRFFLNQDVHEVSFQLESIPGGQGTRARKFLERCLDDVTNEFLDKPAFLDRDGRRPRVDAQGNDVSLDVDIRDNLTARGLTKLKHPLDPSDIIVLKKQLRQALPFNQLPLT